MLVYVYNVDKVCLLIGKTVGKRVDKVMHKYDRSYTQLIHTQNKRN